MTNPRADERSPASPAGPVLLVALAAAASLLAVFQWMELVLLRHGGSPVCNVTNTLNCATVWNTHFATVIHHGLGMPVAALGLVWGLTALAMSLALTWRRLQGGPTAVQTQAVRVVAVVGLVATLVFAAVSLSAEAACLTCLGTYALVIGYLVVSLRLLPRPYLDTAALPRAVMWPVIAAVIFFAALLGPGLSTPTSDQGVTELSKFHAAPQPTTSAGSGAPTADAGIAQAPQQIDAGAKPARPMNADETQLASFLASLSPADQTVISTVLARYRAEQVPVGSDFAPRRLWGDKKAPAHYVEWVDIRCGHCRHLNEAMHQIEQDVPKSELAVEVRHFPLDSECNPNVPASDHSGTRCTAAKALICLESSPDYDSIKDKLFASQEGLNGKDAVIEIASSGSMSKDKLLACIAKPETARKLNEDITYAMRWKPEGTPVVVLNGKSILPIPQLLLALAVTGGNADSPAFDGLPPPRQDAELGP